METTITPQFVIALRSEWLLSTDGYQKRLEQQHLFPLGAYVPALSDRCCVNVKFRDDSGNLRIDDEAEVVNYKRQFFLKSKLLPEHIISLGTLPAYLLFFFEGSPNAARCVIAPADDDTFQLLEYIDPPILFAAYDLPPRDVAVVETERVYRELHNLLAEDDKELFGTNADQFLAAPHILVPLFAHVMSLSSQDNIDFPHLLKATAEQIRVLLTDSSAGPVRIRKLERNHRRLWGSVFGDRIAFADGGAARIAGLAGSEPLALRVGIYSVCPGETDLANREEWRLSPYVVGDLIAACSTGERHTPDPKRLQEASRYVLEALTVMRYIERSPDTAFMFLHGPLVNQFTQYDEGEPNFVPCLSSDFLAENGITEDFVTNEITGTPREPSGRVMWNQFMAVYGAVMRRIFSSSTPTVGVVERTVGHWLSSAVLDILVSEHRITQAHAKRIEAIIDRFQISDDFLFGCVLEEGEYLEPVSIQKNAPRRARERWQEVVRQYPTPQATVLKTATSAFPYRVEMNPAAVAATERTLDVLYHTSRLLPRYAFPVGLDIVDKYAKVPDWLSRGVSARMAADVLARALRTGNPNIVAQVRQFLAHTPRDFFYRPHA